MLPTRTSVLQGTQDLFGSILAKTITNGGNASIHYDRRLSRDFYVAGTRWPATSPEAAFQRRQRLKTTSDTLRSGLFSLTDVHTLDARAAGDIRNSLPLARLIR